MNVPHIPHTPVVRLRGFTDVPTRLQRFPHLHVDIVFVYTPTLLPTFPALPDVLRLDYPILLRFPGCTRLMPGLPVTFLVFCLLLLFPTRLHCVVVLPTLPALRLRLFTHLRVTLVTAVHVCLV